MTISDKTIDRRVVERNIRKGLVSEKEINQYMASLPDKENDCETVVMDGLSDGTVTAGD